MKKSDCVYISFLCSAGVFIYIAAIASLFFYGKDLFGQSPNFLIPLFMLLLFVISASITGLLVLGKPIHLYLSGLKKEAFVLLFSTLAWLVLFLIGVIIILMVQ